MGVNPQLPLALTICLLFLAGCGFDGMSWAIMFKPPPGDLTPGVRSEATVIVQGVPGDNLAIAVDATAQSVVLAVVEGGSSVAEVRRASQMLTGFGVERPPPPSRSGRRGVGGPCATRPACRRGRAISIPRGPSQVASIRSQWFPSC